MGAALGEVAARHGADEGWHDARNRAEMLPAAGLPGNRDALQESPGIWVSGGLEDLVRRALLDDLARIHDRDPVAEARDHPEVVGDEG